MTSDPDSDRGGLPDFSRFLDDFYVECDEHLSVARRGLLSLETNLQQSRFDRGLLDELFRSFHSLKGLAAMVGVREAEQIAHRLESYLGALRKAQTQLTTDGLEALIAGTVAIEQVVAARRDEKETPDVARLLQRLDSFLSTSSAQPPSSQPTPPLTSAAADLAARIAEKLPAGGRAWNIGFAPSPAAAEQGNDVNGVRRRLQETGELIHSEPRIEPGGRIEFHFIVITPTDAMPSFTSDVGLTIKPWEAPAIPTVPASTLEPPKEVERVGASTHLVPANLVRVDLARLDELMRMVGELVLSRSRLEDVLQRLNGVVPSVERRVLDEINLAIEHQLRDLREGVMRIRMVPIREVFGRMQFVIRDLVRDQAKRAVLQLSGEETQIDKYIVERMMDPLLHLVRNAVSHGLESPEERVAAGKPAEAKIHLRAAATGDTIAVEVEDDGRGIDAQAVLARAQRLGVAREAMTSDRAVSDSAALLEVLCLPGFSTRDEADRSSGRGVGMDVVRRAVEELGGTLTLHTELGRGTRFVIQLPLTLAITDALIVSVGNERYAVPQVAVREVIEVEQSDIRSIENHELYNHHGDPLTLLRLDRLFGIADSDAASHHVLVVGEGRQSMGLVVRRMLGLREIVVRPLTDRLVQVPGISGATELGDGQAVLILDVGSLLRLSRSSRLSMKRGSTAG